MNEIPKWWFGDEWESQLPDEFYIANGQNSMLSWTSLLRLTKLTNEDLALPYDESFKNPADLTEMSNRLAKTFR